MNSELERRRLNRRYLALFGAYAPHVPLVRNAKDIINQQQHAHPRLEIRGDALLFMLGSHDHSSLYACIGLGS